MFRHVLLTATKTMSAVTALCVVLAPCQALAQTGLIHRYSFATDANDSVGTSHGTVVDAGTTASFSFTNGTLDFSANAGNASNAITEDAYLNLPNGLISSSALSGNGVVAFEWWYTVAENRTWQRVGDFGNSNNGEDTSASGAASAYLSVVTTSGRNNVVDMTNHTTTGQEPVIGQGGTPVIGQQYQVMAVYNHNYKRNFVGQASNGTMTLYVNGTRIGYAAIHPDINIRTFNDVNNWLGRSQWPDPLFDGAYDEFRIYNRAPTDAYVTNSFNAGPNALAPFEEFTPDLDVSLVVDRSTGKFSLQNAAASANIVRIRIQSASGALDTTKWLSVTNANDFDSGGATPFDTDDNWSVTTQTAFDLNETTPTGNGGQLGTGGTKTSILLGDTGAWRISRFEDVTVTVERLLPNFAVESLPVRVVYQGGIGSTAARADLNFDGLLTAADWTAFASNHNKDLLALTVQQAAALGDLNGDKFNNYDDFLLFRADYIAANGAPAFAALLAIPEPSSIAMLSVAGCAALCARRRTRLRRRHSSASVLSVIAMTSFGFAFSSSSANAQLVRTVAGNFTTMNAPTNYSIPYSLLAGGNTNALIVGTYADNAGNVASNALYNGVAANGILQNDRINAFYWLNPAATGNITFDLTAINSTSTASAYFAVELQGVNTSSSVDTGTGADITTTQANRYIVNFFGENNSVGTNVIPAVGAFQKKIGAANANGAGGGGSLVLGVAEGRGTGAPGVKNVDWTGGVQSGRISFGFDAPPPILPLTLQVNKSTGEVKIRNNTANPISMDYYLVTSSATMLDVTAGGWNSLDDKNFQQALPANFDKANSAIDQADLVAWRAAYGQTAAADANFDGRSDGIDFLSWQRSLGKAPTAADGWLEAGGSTSREVGELFPTGGSVFAPGQEVSLGNLYNETLTPGVDGDLTFTVSTLDSDTLFQGVVQYIPSATPTAGAVPEPSSALLGIAALGALAWIRRTL